MRVAVVHGPNLNLLGTRQPEIYGSETLEELQLRIREWGVGLGAETEFHQSNDESELVELIQASSRSQDAIIINAGGFTHTSVAIADAIASGGVPTVEVHLSDINRREQWRSKSLIKPVAVRQISGRGPVGYRDALRHLQNRQSMPFTEVDYGAHPDNVVDLRSPSEDGGLLVVLIHGGFWLNPWERDSMESLAINLTEAGYRTANVEYRRTPTWPASAHDVETAIGTVAEPGAPVAIIGHSAGGYLGLWLTARLPVAAFIGLASITDLDLARNETESAATLIESGAPPQPHPRASTLLIHGEGDELVTPRHSSRIDGEAEIQILPDVGHFDLLRGDGQHFDLIVETLGKAFN